MPAQLIFGDIRDLPPNDFRIALKEVGITRIDTAARYQNGESEKIIGRAELAQDFAIDTKIKLTEPSAGSLSAAAIDASLTNSLRVLGTDRVNVLYCHGPDFQTPIAEQAKAFHDHYQRGRFTHLGVSNFSTAMLQEWLDIASREGYVKPSVFQGQYNLLCRGYEATLFPLLRAHQIGFAAYSPLAGGFLLGNLTATGIQGGRRFAANTPYTQWYDHSCMHEAVARLRAISLRTGLGMDELSFRWLRYHSALRDVDVMIMGASKTVQIASSVHKAESGPLAIDVAADLSALWEDVKDVGAKITEY